MKQFLVLSPEIIRRFAHYMWRATCVEKVSAKFLEDANQDKHRLELWTSSPICGHRTSICVKVSMNVSIPMVKAMKKTARHSLLQSQSAYGFTILMDLFFTAPFTPSHAP